MGAEMKRLRSDDDETLDRLSDLPDSLILEILSRVGNMRDVVKTSLLSKRWVYLWITVPCLRFIEGNTNSTLNFINRTLMLWKGNKLREFVIDVITPSDNDIDLWVLFAKERNVENLSIHLQRRLRNKNSPLYRPPQSLYECSCLVHLSLGNCDFRIPRNLQWDKLKSLWIVGYRFTEGVIDLLVSSAPLLQDLALVWGSNLQDLIIQSSSLKKLHIKSLKCVPSPSVFTIWAPKLQSLEILGAPPSKCVLTAVSSLTRAMLDVSEKCAAVVGETLTQFLPAIQHVRWLQLSTCFFKMLGVMKGKCSFSPLLNVSYLGIRGGPIQPNEIFGLAKHFPNMKDLRIDWKLDIDINGEPFNFGEIVYEANAHNQLTTVAIIWYSYDVSIFQFIEILLKHAPRMEIMWVLQKTRGNEVVESQDMLMATQKIVSLQRSFPTARLILAKLLSNYRYVAQKTTI